MRVSQQEKQRSHTRIVAGAARLVRERGIDATSVSDVMSDAGMTNGGFYKHFDNKEALVAAALRAAFDEMIAVTVSQLDLEGGLAGFQSFYLSDGHVAAPGVGCPVAALGGDVARASATLKGEFGAGVHRMIAALAEGMAGTAAEKDAAAARLLATMVGAVVIARASDPASARAVLAASAG